MGFLGRGLILKPFSPSLAGTFYFLKRETNLFPPPSYRREPKLTKGILQRTRDQRMNEPPLPTSPLARGLVCEHQKKEQLILFPAELVDSLLPQFAQEGL